MLLRPSVHILDPLVNELIGLDDEISYDRRSLHGLDTYFIAAGL